MAKQATAPDADQTPDTELQAKLTATEQELAGVKQQLATTTAELTATKADRDTLASANESLDAENESLKGQLSDKQVELEQAEALIEQQNDALKSAEVSIAAGPVIVTHEKAQYRLLVERFSHAGTIVEAASLRQNPDLVRQLVEMGSGLLVKVEAAS